MAARYFTCCWLTTSGDICFSALHCVLSEGFLTESSVVLYCIKFLCITCYTLST
jgi:hypothetical protein